MLPNIKPVQLLLLKLANTCNINCTYCYWFKDKSVYENSKIIRDDVLDSFYLKLRGHIAKYNINYFTIVLHGGEPLLIGKSKFEQLLYKLYSIQCDLDVELNFEIQTNGILIDNDWIDIMKSFNVHIGVSIDGPKKIHDLFRRDLRGKPTFDKTYRAIKLLQSRNINFGALAVCNPMISAEETCNFFIQDLGLKTFDILIPGASYEDKNIVNINDFYNDLFVLWFEKYRHQGINIKIARNILNGIQGKKSNMQSIGHNLVDILMIKPNGEMEAVDYLHSLGYGFTKSHLNILYNEIQDIENDELWREVYDSSINLNEKCNSCKFKFGCGGGHIGSRWSNKNRFDNPSVYCDQLFDIFECANNLLTEQNSKNQEIEIV